jgi:hypothetical protein
VVPIDSERYTVKIKELAQDHVARPLWGFVPGREVKPVHFANRFFRALCAQEGKPSLVHAATGLSRPGNKHMPSEVLLTEHPDCFEGASHSRAIERVDELRTVLDLVLNQDRAVYPSTTSYSFTLTHRNLTSPDPSDQGTGRFLAGILAATPGGVSVETLRQALDDRSDPITQLATPLLPSGPMGPAPEKPDQESVTAKLLAVSSTLSHLQVAFEQLAQHNERLEKTEFLRRAVTLGAFGLVLHVLNSTERARTGKLIPLLVCAEHHMSDVREASRASIHNGLRQIDRAFEEELARLLHQRGEAGRDEMYYRTLMDNWLDTSGLNARVAAKAESARKRFDNDFRLELAGSADPFDAFLRAAVPAAFAVIGANSPERFVLALGRLCGLLFPRAQGRGDKYVMPAAPFYDTLVAALLAPGEEIAADEFWARARERFGLLAGADPYGDASCLAESGIRLASERSLAANAAALASELEEVGHARRYADGFTLVRVAH